ncbi:MAG: hypothetical protein ACE5FY_01995 [Nitrospiria bacterium]
MENSASDDKAKFEWKWMIPFIRNLIHDGFTGSIRINFHKGSISKRIEKTSFISEK